MSRKIKSALLASALALGAGLATSQARANTIDLTFGGLSVSGTPIDNYFNGGTDPFKSTNVGPTDGVTFSKNQGPFNISAVEDKSGFAGKFENNPSGANGVLFGSIQQYMNISGGITGLSAVYSLSGNTGSSQVELWSGLNGTGSVLDTLTLTPKGSTVACISSTDNFCTWSSISAANFGIAESITFGGGNVEFDQLGLTTTPIPAALPLFAGGIGLMGMLAWRRKQKAVAAVAGT